MVGRFRMTQSVGTWWDDRRLDDGFLEPSVARWCSESTLVDIIAWTSRRFLVSIEVAPGELTQNNTMFAVFRLSATKNPKIVQFSVLTEVKTNADKVLLCSRA